MKSSPQASQDYSAASVLVLEKEHGETDSLLSAVFRCARNARLSSRSFFLFVFLKVGIAKLKVGIARVTVQMPKFNRIMY